VEAAASVLKPNVSHKPVCKEAVNVLLQLSKNSDGSNAIAEHGGTMPMLRAMDKIVNAENSNSNGEQDFSDVILDMCNTLENVSKTAKGRKRLNKDKCVERLVGAMVRILYFFFHFMCLHKMFSSSLTTTTNKQINNAIHRRIDQEMISFKRLQIVSLQIL